MKNIFVLCNILEGAKDKYIINEAGKQTSEDVPEMNKKQTIDDVVSFLVSKYHSRKLLVLIDSKKDYELLEQKGKEKIPNAEFRIYNK